MTFVGKILVIIIMVFALFFLAVSTVVFTTEKNWKDALAAKTKDFQKVTTEKSTVQAALDKSQQDYQQAEAKAKADKAQYEAEIAKLQESTKQATEQFTKQVAVVETAQQTAKAAQDEAASRKAETDELRKLLAEVQKQANDFKLRQTELNDEIRNLQRDVKVAQDNNRDLRDRVAGLSDKLRSLGYSPDARNLAGDGSTPKEEVEGVVRRVEKNKWVEISLGSDDGIAEGNVLDIYHLNPPEYLGKIKIETVSADQSVGQVVGGQPRLGLKIKEGDIVSSKIRAR